MDDKPREELERRMDELAGSMQRPTSQYSKRKWKQLAAASLECWTTTCWTTGGRVGRPFSSPMSGRPVKLPLEIRPRALSSHVDCFAHGIGQHDELGGPSVFVPSKRHDVSLDRHGWRGA